MLNTIGPGLAARNVGGSFHYTMSLWADDVNGKSTSKTKSQGVFEIRKHGILPTPYGLVSNPGFVSVVKGVGCADIACVISEEVKRSEHSLTV